MTELVRDAFRQQAGFARVAGSELTARVLESLARILDNSTRTGAHILAWPGDPIRDALKLRLAGGLHALARSGADIGLTELYLSGEGRFDDILARVLRDHDDRLYPWLDRPPQTNEVGRAAALWPGIMEVARRFGPVIELIELGPSAGLNLNMDRFDYDLGGVRSGDAASPVKIAPRWSGAPPAIAPVEIVSRIGVDQNPLDVSNDEIAERLIAYVWPDQPARLARIEGAIALARQFPPPLVQGDAVNWLDGHFKTTQRDGVTRIVYHSVVLQYLSREGRQRIAEMLAEAGKSTTLAYPLAWLSLEHHAVGAPAELRLTCWPEGKQELLADVHPHGAYVDWRGD